MKYWIHFVIVWVYEAQILHWFLAGVDRIYIFISIFVLSHSNRSKLQKSEGDVSR